MEILSYVLAGRLEHADSAGHGGVLEAGEWQRISAGTGVLHSEYNPDRREPVHFYQICIVPRERGLPPSYEQKRFGADEKRDRWRLVASADGRDGSLTIRQDARVYLADLAAGKEVTHELASGRHAWLQVVRGKVSAGDQQLKAGDGLAVSDEPGLVVRAEEAAEVILFDLA
jgi:redox-sensitive bicupin YhaK (pirin superfamily)